MITSTSHSGSPSMMSGGGFIKLGPCSFVFLYGKRYDVWKTLWIFHDLGSWSWYATWLMALITLNGPYLLAQSLCVGWVVFRFLASSQTLFPFWYPTYDTSFVIIIWLWSIAYWAPSRISHNWVCHSFIEVPLFCKRNCPFGISPMRTSYGGIFVVWDGLEFITYWAMGIHFAQSSCCSLQNIQR
jgi:hypothetical protein